MIKQRKKRNNISPWYKVSHNSCGCVEGASPYINSYLSHLRLQPCLFVTFADISYWLIFFLIFFSLPYKGEKVPFFPIQNFIALMWDFFHLAVFGSDSKIFHTIFVHQYILILFYNALPHYTSQWLLLWDNFIKFHSFSLVICGMKPLWNSLNS